MTLLAIRTRAAKLSGRYDLVDPTTFADNGMDDYINDGLRFLDRQARFIDERAVYVKTVTAGEYYVEFENCRTIEAVWVANATARWELDFLSFRKFREDYAGPLGDEENGSPSYFTRAFLRSVPDKTALDKLSGWLDYIAVDGSQRQSGGVLFMPPADEALQVEVLGTFSSPTLSNDTDTNFWTENHPNLLVWATLYQLEVSYRNTAGANDWLASIKAELFEIEKDIVAEEVEQAEEMEG